MRCSCPRRAGRAFRRLRRAAAATPRLDHRAETREGGELPRTARQPLAEREPDAQGVPHPELLDPRTRDRRQALPLRLPRIHRQGLRRRHEEDGRRSRRRSVGGRKPIRARLPCPTAAAKGEIWTDMTEVYYLQMNMTPRERVLTAFAHESPTACRAGAARRRSSSPRRSRSWASAGHGELLRPLRRRLPPRLRPLRRAGGVRPTAICRRARPIARRSASSGTGYGYGQPISHPLAEATLEAGPRLPVARSGVDGRLAHPRRGAGLGPAVRDPRRRLVAVLARRDRPAGHGEPLPQDVRRAGTGGRRLAAHRGLLRRGQPADLRRGGRRASTSSSSATISAARPGRC